MSTSNPSPDPVPHHAGFIYGTAWKKERTLPLVKQALEAGFRAIDTAAQPRHYDEKAVGEALRQAYAERIVRREDIYIQTKYTSPAGQDKSNMPYDPSADLETQIRTSINSSLSHLRTSPEPLSPTEDPTYIDALLLHSPLPSLALNLQAWKILESYVPHRIHRLGISNTDLLTLQHLYDNSTIKPSIVQNRFYARTLFDVKLREFCDAHSITYQSFWTLTGNPFLLTSSLVAKVAQRARVSKEVVLYALVMELGILVLNGTSDARHMRADLEGVERVKAWAREDAESWGRVFGDFKEMVE